MGLRGESRRRCLSVEIRCRNEGVSDDQVKKAGRVLNENINTFSSVQPMTFVIGNAPAKVQGTRECVYETADDVEIIKRCKLKMFKMKDDYF